jgi:serine/threonine protein kinase
LNEEYEEGEELSGGSGHCSVKIFRHRKTGEEVAVKIFSIPSGKELQNKIQEEFIREAETLIQLEHPCIVKMKGICLPRGNEGPKIIMELVGGGSLKEVVRSDLKRPKWWRPTRRVITIMGLVLGMKYIESKNLIHRDLKPSNILLDDDHRIKICDFGSSRIYEIDVTMTTTAGTPLYMAPEVAGGHYDGKVDVYSFGLILYEILGGNGIFSNSGNKYGLFMDLQRGNRPSIPEEVSKTGRELIEKCWSQDPRRRPRFDEIMRYQERVDFEIIDDVQKGEVRSFLKGMGI